MEFHSPPHLMPGAKNSTLSSSNRMSKEQQELDELKKQMEENQRTLQETMSKLEMKSASIQEKLERREELSKANAQRGIVKKVAYEYKVVDVPSGYILGSALQAGVKKPNPAFGFGAAPSAPSFSPESSMNAFGEHASKFVHPSPDPELIYKQRSKIKEFESTTLKELGEDGWKLQSINSVFDYGAEVIHLYYFSRPL